MIINEKTFADCLSAGQLIFNNSLFNSLEPYSKKELWALWHEYEEDSRCQTRDGAQSHKDPPTVVLKTGAVVAYISGNY